MGKRSTAARGARRAGKARKTSMAKIRNKQSQRTPKVVRKQMKKAQRSKQAQWNEMFDSSKKKIASLSFENMNKKIHQELNPKESRKNKLRKRNKMKNKKQVKDKLEKKKKNKGKGKQKNGKKDELFDFSQYNREKDDLSSEGSLSEKEDIDQEEHDRVEKYERKRIDSNNAYSWDTSNNSNNNKVDNKKEKEKKDDVSDNENESDSESEIEDDDIDYNSSDNSKGNSNKKRQVQISFGEWKLRKAGRRESLKLEIADMCEKIVSDPYIHCRLFELLYSLVEDQDIEIMQCSMLSLTRTIIDVMPPYRIGTINNNVKLKQENEKVRNFENQLLTTYQKFLKFLFKSSQLFHSNVNISRLNKQNNGRQRLIMGKCAVKCNCMFLKHASHFNYTKEVIKRTIPLLNSPDKSIRIESCNAMKNILSNEPINNVTVEAVKSICGKIESRNFECSQECIDVFLALPLKLLHPPDTKMDDDDENNKPTKSKQEKKLEALVSKDLKELDGLDKKKEYERQKVIIESIFGIYFFILKLDVKTKRSNGSNSNGKGQQKKSIYKQGHLLACALKGMAKFAQLVNVELVVTLVCVVSEKLKDEANNLSLETKLHCILTAFGCISGRGTAIEMDLKEHFVTLYSILSEMIYYYNWQHFELIFECFNKMFYNKRRKVIVDRIAAFIKRLMTLSLHIPPQYSIACMHQIRKLIKLDARLECMLEQGGGYDQIFDGKNDNPDQSHALASCLWECTANCNNFHLFCRKYARDLTGLKDIPLQLEMEKPWNLIKEYDHSRRGNFNPIIKYSQRQEKKSKNNKGKKELTDWNNETKINQIIDEWFEFDTNEIKDRERKNYQFDDNTATNCLNYYFNCNKLCQRNDTLFELNDKFVTLNQLLMED